MPSWLKRRKRSVVRRVNIPFQFSFQERALRVAGEPQTLIEKWKEVPGEEPVKGDWLVEACISSSAPEPVSKDRISKKALEKGAQDLLTMRTVLFNHDPNIPIGRILKTRVEDGELKALLRISKTRPEFWEMIKDGTLEKWSVRGTILELDADPSWQLAPEGRPQGEILDWFLKESSLVAVAAQPKAVTKGWWVQKDWRDEMSENVSVQEHQTPEVHPESLANTPEAVPEPEPEITLEYEIEKSGPEPLAKAGIAKEQLERLKNNLEKALEAKIWNERVEQAIRAALALIDLVIEGTYPYPKPYPYPYPPPKSQKGEGMVTEPSGEEEKEGGDSMPDQNPQQTPNLQVQEPENQSPPTSNPEQEGPKGEAMKSDKSDEMAEIKKAIQVLMNEVKKTAEIAKSNAESLKTLRQEVPVRKSSLSEDEVRKTASLFDERLDQLSLWQ